MPQFRFQTAADQRPRPILAAVQLVLGLVVLISLAAFAGFLLLAVILIGVPALFLFIGWLRLKATWRDYRYLQGLKSAGRTAAWKDVEPDLNAGRGTLIFEFHAGSLRAWWTSEDALGPEGDSLPTQLPSVGKLFFVRHEQPDEAVILARQINEWYLDPATGRAKWIVDFPLAKTESPASNFPRLQIVTLVTDFNPPLIARGFGSPQETTVPPEAETSERQAKAESRRLPSA